MDDPTARAQPLKLSFPAQRSPEELEALAEQIARHMEDFDRRACLVNHWKCEVGCGGWVKVDWPKIVEGVIGFVDLEVSPQYAAGVAEGRRQAAEDLTTWLDRLADRLPQYNPELPVCARRTNAAVLGAYERAAAIARDPRDNTRCSNCGDTRGGAPEHETSECVWDRHRMDDLLDVPREEPAAEPVGEHSHG